MDGDLDNFIEAKLRGKVRDKGVRDEDEYNPWRRFPTAKPNSF